jgi:hypothetical protein
VSFSLRVLSFACMLAVITVGGTVRAGAPNSCSFLTPAAVSTAIGQPVTGGTQSVVNDPSSSTSICMYRAGSLLIILSVNQLPSAAAARTEFGNELDKSRSHDEDAAQKAVSVPGIGDGAFYSADGPALVWTGLRGSYVVSIAQVGGAAAVPQDHMRGLLQTALSHN